MRVVDSSAWIEWLIDTKTGAIVEGELPKREDWVVPTIVQMEVVKWLARERGSGEIEHFLGFTQRCIVVPLDTRLALSAAELSARHKLAAADAIIYATALEYDADLLTCDAHFEGLERVVLVGNAEG